MSKTTHNKGIGKIRGLYQRGQVYWYQPPQKMGKRPQPFSLDTSDEGVAVARILEFRQGPTTSASSGWRADIEAYMHRQIADRRLSRFYASSRKSVLLAFAKEFCIESPRQVTTAQCQAWYDKLKTANPHTAKHYIVHLRVFLSDLQKRGIIRSNPAREVRMMKVRQKAKTDFIEKRGARKLLAFARLETRRAKSAGDEKLLRTAREREFMLHMGFDAGMRKNEMIEARRGWFQVARDAIHISDTSTYTPKDLEDRSIPLTNRFKRFLKREYPELPAPWVLRPEKTHGKQLYRFESKNMMSAFFKRAGVKSVNGRLPHIHMLRHSFASNRLIEDVNPYKVAKWLGDDFETMCRHYGHLLAKDDQVNKGV